MSWIGAGIATITFSLFTAGAFMASAAGWGLPGKLDKPVSIREGSVGGGARRTGMFLYFGSTRRHLGGGFHGGK